MVHTRRSYLLVALVVFAQVTTPLQQRSFLDISGGRCADCRILRISLSSGGIFRSPTGICTSKSPTSTTCRNTSMSALLSLSSSSHNNNNNDEETTAQESSPTQRRLQTLALHGSGGRALDFEQRTLQKWKDNLLASTTGTGDDSKDSSTSTTITTTNRMVVDLDVTTVQGPVPKEDGFAWWFLPPGVRSSTAVTYEGFDDSCHLVMDALEKQSSSSSSPFDLIVGHSQGAILLTALLALGKLEGRSRPMVGYILNGVAWPNPYTKQLESLKIATTTTTAGPPRVLVIVGERDAMNPPEQGQRVAQALQQAGYSVTTLYHPGGHAVPAQRDETWNSIQTWIVEGSAMACVTD